MISFQLNSNLKFWRSFLALFPLLFQVGKSTLDARNFLLQLQILRILQIEIVLVSRSLFMRRDRRVRTIRRKTRVSIQLAKLRSTSCNQA